MFFNRSLRLELMEYQYDGSDFLNLFTFLDTNARGFDYGSFVQRVVMMVLF